MDVAIVIFVINVFQNVLYAMIWLFAKIASKFVSIVKIIFVENMLRSVKIANNIYANIAKILTTLAIIVKNTFVLNVQKINWNRIKIANKTINFVKNVNNIVYVFIRDVKYALFVTTIIYNAIFVKK